MAETKVHAVVSGVMLGVGWVLMILAASLVGSVIAIGVGLMAHRYGFGLVYGAAAVFAILGGAAIGIVRNLRVLRTLQEP